MTKKIRTSIWLSAGILILAIGIAIWMLSPKAIAQRQDVSVQDLAALESKYVLDVRQDWEYAEGHVPDAVLIPLDQLESRLDEIPRNKAVYIICRSGNRSLTASKILLDNGFADVNNVLGGTLAWIEAGYPVAQ